MYTALSVHFLTKLNSSPIIDCLLNFYFYSFGTSYLHNWLISHCPITLSGLQSLSHLCALRDIFGCRPAKSQGNLMMKYLIHLHLYKAMSPTYLQCTVQVKQVGNLFLSQTFCAILFSFHFGHLVSKCIWREVCCTLCLQVFENISKSMLAKYMF